jgi:serine/threonine protein kinase
MATLRKQRIFETAFSRYLATEQAGQGGTGTVFKATDDGGKAVAIKLLNPAMATPERRRRFKNELTFGLRNQHENIITVLDHGVASVDGQSAPFYVMPFYAGSLRSLMSNGMKPGQVLPLFAQCLAGVEAAHLLNTIHRDLKPENILHDGSGNIVVADFGIAEFSHDELYTLVETKPGAKLANYMYAAPEQKDRSGRCAQATDIFALGLILNEMFTGAVPHGAGYSTIGARHPDLAYLDDLVAWMIQQDINKRPDSVAVVKDELIGRRNAFVERQELDRLKQMVIPVTALDDPIEADPIRVVGAGLGDDGILTIRLNQSPNPAWIQALQFGNYSKTSIMNVGPERFSFRGNVASVRVAPDSAQRAIDFFKEWLRPANEIYIRERHRNKELEEKKRREALERQVREREKRNAVNAGLRI